MDRPQEEMQLVGFLGIQSEAFKFIFSWKKIFTQITLTLILPLSFIFLSHFNISNLLFTKISLAEYDTSTYDHLSHTKSSEWINYWLFKAGYFTFLLIFSLLSTAAVVYTIACIYTGREVTFKKVMKVIPRVWKRLFLTFLCMYLAFFIYNVIAGLMFFAWERTISRTVFGVVMFFILLIIYVVGFVYLSVVWHLASVVTVLERSYGFKAMMKGKDLVKGKRWVAMGIFFMLYCIFAVIVIVFVIFVMWWGMDMVMRVVLGLVCLFLLLKLFLYGLVTQTVLYLVCKSYHRETIDKLSLSTQLGGYLGEYEPALRVNKDIQLGQPQPQAEV